MAKGLTGKMNDTAKNLLRLIPVLTLMIVSAGPARAFDFAYDLSPEITAAMESHDTAAVLNHINAHLGIDPNYAPLYLLRGQIYYARGQYDQALEQFETALDKKSKLNEARYYKGLIHLNRGEFEDAEKAFDKGLKDAKNSGKAPFFNGKGLLLIKREQYSDADLEFRKAITLDPDNAEYYANLGDANYFAKLYPLAISEYNKVIEMDTTFIDVYFRLARAYVAQNQYSEALEQLRVVLTRDSTYAQAWKEIGRMYTLAGLSATDRDTRDQRFREAIGSYNKYLTLTGDSADGEIFFNIGRSYFNLGGFPLADSSFEYVLSIGDEPKGIYLYLGRGYIVEENYTKAIEMLQKHLDKFRQEDPDWTPGVEEADVYRRLGDAHKALDDWESAAANYVKAHNLNPSEPRYVLEAAVAYHQLKDYETALEYYDKRMGMGNGSWSIYLNAAGCAYNLEDYERAVTYLEDVVSLDSTKERAFALLSDAYLNRLEDCENGVMWTTKWLAMDSTNCDAYKSLGLAYLSNICPANYLKAVDFFDRTLKCYKAKGMNDCSSFDVMLYLAQAYHLHAADLVENDRKEESKTYFEKAFNWYKKVLKCDPGNKDAKEGVAQTEFEF